MSTPTNSFPAAASFALTDTFLMNVAGASSKVTGTNTITSLGVPTLTGTNVLTGQNTISTKPIIINNTDGSGFGGGGEWIVQTQFGAGIATFSGGIGHENICLISSTSNSVASAVAVFGSNDHSQVTIPNAYGYGWASGVNSAFANVALFRLAAAVVQVTTGESISGGGTGGGFNFPQTAADADMAAPTTGATLYSKQVVGKNALFVRFPSGASQQLAIEL